MAIQEIDLRHTNDGELRVVGVHEDGSEELVDVAVGSVVEETDSLDPAAPVDVEQIAADPADVPPPIDRDEPVEHDVTLQVEEVTAEIEPGVTFDFLTFEGQVPGPMIRVREGDTVSLTLENPSDSSLPHNNDFHAVYGTGGGSAATMTAPGGASDVEFRCEYPGAFIYHCAVPRMDYHISAGMFGMILVEPADGLPPVDREFYLGQHEVYTKGDAGEEGHHDFDFDAMVDERPTYVLFNGEKQGYASGNRGPLSASVGETARVYMVNGGPNLTSSFHPIGNVWSDLYRSGDLVSDPARNVETTCVPPGCAVVGDMNLPVPETIKFVDHALSRVVHKGLLAELEVTGPENPDVFDPDPS